MKQRPKYLIIGSGLMATHFGHYLQLLELSYKQWSRSVDSNEALIEYSKNCTHILFLISDQAIEGFIKNKPFLLKKCCVHFSGAMVIHGLFSTHPLMTFSRSLYDLDTYRSIPFILEQGGPGLEELLPDLPNYAYKIPGSAKPLYHALTAMGNNFSTMLWQHVLHRFHRDLNLPLEAIAPILKQTAINLLEQPQNALSGPLVRGDQNTIKMHLEILADDLYKDIYQGFIKVFAKHQQEMSK